MRISVVTFPGGMGCTSVIGAAWLGGLLVSLTGQFWRSELEIWLGHGVGGASVHRILPMGGTRFHDEKYPVFPYCMIRLSRDDLKGTCFHTPLRTLE